MHFIIIEFSIMIVMIMDISEFMVDATQQQPHQQQFDFDVPIANVIALTNIEKEMIIKRHTNANKSDDIIRCFCNLPRCVLTGYMCQTSRSGSGGCFSELRNSENKLVPKHGCIEILQKDNRRTYPQCDNSPRKYGKTLDDSLILCCYDNMCNGHDHSPPNLITENDGNSTVGDNRYRHRTTSVSSQNSSDLWFKIATIIFPIFGVLILISLIILAIKILKTDNFHSQTSATPNKCDRNDFNEQNVQIKNSQTTIKSTSVNIGLMSDLNKTLNEHNNCNNDININDIQINKLTNSLEIKNDHYIRIPTYSTSEYNLIPQYFYEPLIDNNSTNKSNVFIHSDRSVSKLSAAIFKALNHNGTTCDQQINHNNHLSIKNGIK